MLFLLAAGGQAAQANGIWAGSGSNGSGQLGTGTPQATNDFLTAMDVSGVLSGKTLVALSAGLDHACGLDDMGVVYCWGNNDSGQLAVAATTASSASAVVVSGGSLGTTRVKSVRAGYKNTCAIDVNEVAHCWGYNAAQQLATATAVNSFTPVQIPLTSVKSISISETHACAVSAQSGSALVYCWGQNNSGQLGTTGSTANTQSGTPTLISTSCATAGSTRNQTSAASGKTFKEVRVGKGSANSLGTTCAVTTDGIAVCWGQNARLELGNTNSGGGGTGTNVGCPSAVLTTGSLSGKTVSNVYLGAGSNPSMGCALDTDGGLHCWGNQTDGALGNNVTGNSNIAASTKVQIPQISAGVDRKVVKASIGRDHACANTADGKVYCWGANTNNEFGTGTTSAAVGIPIEAATSSTTSATPTAGTAVFSGTAFTDVVTGNDFSLFAAPAAGPGFALKASVFQMLSLPCDPPANSTVASLFGTGTSANFNTTCYGDNSGGCAGQGWLVYSFNRSNTSATGTYTQLSSSSIIKYADPSTGDGGYWILSVSGPQLGKLFTKCKTGSSKPSANFTGTPCVGSNGCFAVPIATNRAGNTYNLVPNPFPYAVNWADVRICEGTSANSCTASYTPAQAQAANIVSETISIYSGTAYVDYNMSSLPGNLAYFQSFWVNVLPAGYQKTLRLLIPATPSSTSTAASASVGTGSTASPAKKAPAQALANEWRVRFAVFDFARNMSHENTVIGRMAGAAEGFDSLDVARTSPFSSPYLYLAVPQPGWGARAGDYAADIRQPVIQAASRWPLVIKADKAGGTVRLKWSANSSSVLRACRLQDTAARTSIDPSRFPNGVDIRMDTATKNLLWSCNGI